MCKGFPNTALKLPIANCKIQVGRIIISVRIMIRMREKSRDKEVSRSAGVIDTKFVGRSKTFERHVPAFFSRD